MPASGAVVIAGASGFIGTALVDALRAQGRPVIQLVRRAPASADERMWDPDAGWVRREVIDGADAVVNLSGASIARLPWTLPYKKVILRSRVQATSTLASAIAGVSRPPRVFVSASASGYYGNRPGQVLAEDAGPGDGFLVKVVQAWEAAAQPAALATRVVHPRTGIVLGRGGVIGTLRKLATFGLAGPLGSGTQHWPWLSLRDQVGALIHLIDTDLQGPVNLAAPVPATAERVLRSVATQLHRPYWLPVPSWTIRLALADAGRELLLADQEMTPAKLITDGYEFDDVDLDSAVQDALARG